MQNKGGQVTLFIIIALVIAAGISAFFYFRESAGLHGQTDPTVIPIYTFTESCLKDAVDEAIVVIGLQGGYSSPENYLEAYIGDVAYWCKDSKKSIPSILTITNEINNYIKYDWQACTGGFYDFQEQGFEINESMPVIKAEIQDKKIVVKGVYDLTIKKGDLTYKIKDFSDERIINFKAIYGDAVYLADSVDSIQKENPDYIDFTALGDIMIQSDFEPSLYSMSDEEKFFVLIDNSTIINDEPYVFAFAIKI